MESSDTVTRIEHEGRTFYLVGTAHISAESVDEVRRVIEEVRPDSVCIELCPTRYAALTDENRWKNLDIFEVIRSGKTLLLLANLAIGAYQRRLGAELGVKPGAEMLAAANVAEELGAEVVLVDRDIQITLKRTWANVGFVKKAMLLSAILDSLFSKGGEKIDRETIEQLKERENLSNMLEEFARAMPEVKGPLIDERDLYMVSKVREAPGDTVVVVVGAGHVPGMTLNFDTPIDREPLDALPAPKAWVQAAKWVIPAAVLAAFWFGWQKNEGRSFDDFLLAWVLPNAVFAGVFTMLAGAKLPSIFVAITGSPVTSLNPLLPIGIPVGFTEAWFRKPTVDDAERIPEDVQTLRGFYRNAVTRTLLVTMLSIIGSAVGAWVGLGWLFTLLGR